MTTTAALRSTPSAPSPGRRFRLARAGILNVWQYDEQVFTFADGRLLLRGANGAGKSKTLEMLLPFALDGDKARITASAKHHTSLLWLMTDGLDAGNRVGYVWVEFERDGDGTAPETFTCGVGIRASVSARSATAWHFTTSRRVGHDLFLEDEGGPLSRPRLVEALGDDGQVFDKAADYKAHVGRDLFGLDVPQYDEVLRLLYWLRQPQVGEDIEPAKLARQLSQALPQLDEQAVQSAGDTFDELTAVGEQLDRRAKAADALETLADAYATYARAITAERAGTLHGALTTERRLSSAVSAAEERVDEVIERLRAAEEEQAAAEDGRRADEARLAALRESPEYREQRRLDELAEQARVAREQADGATARRDRQARSVEDATAAVTRRTEVAEQRAGRVVTRLHEIGPRLRQDVPDATLVVPAVLDGMRLDESGETGTLGRGVDEAEQTVREGATACSVRLAAVDTLRHALTAADRSADARDRAESAAEDAETRWETARAHRLQAEERSAGEEQALATALATWAAERPTIAPSIPEDLDDDVVGGLARLAEDAAAPSLEAQHTEKARAQHERDVAGEAIDALEEERRAIEGERDPAPPAPSLERTPRPDGHALWRVVDVAVGVDADERAALEAALQDAGLLTAWVRPGGRLLDAEHVDVVLGSTEETPTATLADVLTVDLPPGSDLEARDVQDVLSAIGLGEQETTTWVSRDGSWRLGPAHGRSRKPSPQYIGATARAHERARRLALVDEQLAARRTDVETATREHTTATAEIAGLTAWVRGVPPGASLLRARTVVGERTAHEARAEGENRQAQDAAHEARARATADQRHVDRLAAEHRVPGTRAELDAFEQRVRGIDRALDGVGRDLPTLREAVVEWGDSCAALADGRAALATEEEMALAAEERAHALSVELDELRSSVGTTVAELQGRLDEVRGSLSRHEATARTATTRANDLRADDGRARSEADAARAQLAEHRQVRTTAVADIVTVIGVPGVMDAAEIGDEDVTALRSLERSPSSDIGRAVTSEVGRLAKLSHDAVEHARTRLWRVFNDATNGPAADHQPTMSEFGPVLAVTAQDDGGEASVITLAARVATSVSADRELLTERERTQFEQHVLGELGDALRRCRRDAEELVTAMNEQLGHVTTSQGIRIRLRWDLRESVPPDARAAVQLLSQPVGALVPEERAELRDALHRLINASRAERPELSYGEHLASALDYRSWSEFTIRYARPERPGQWDRLHRRSALSQGEQKVLCYLPLFAAAAAHFTSLAGAAPFAPRLVLLDDAFPKIDERTHPLLFGLLVQLDLDFVITSERLWGDHATVPSLAIYEALRSPGQRGIAQYSYRWDGAVLQGLG